MASNPNRHAIGPWNVEDITPGNDARTILREGQVTELLTFTGTDVKAFLLPDGDYIAEREAQRLLAELAQAVKNDTNQITNTQDIGLTEAVEVISDSPKPEPILPLIGLHSITISTFRAKSQVRALGHTNARGLARGSRTVAGTFILTEFDRDSFWGILTAPLKDQNIGDVSAVLPDQMRPFDIILLMANELGNLGIRHLYGVEIVTNGIVYSVQDYYTENTISYIAQDTSPLIPLTDLPGYGELSKQGIPTGANRVQLQSKTLSWARGQTVMNDLKWLHNSRSPFK